MSSDGKSEFTKAYGDRGFAGNLNDVWRGSRHILACRADGAGVTHVECTSRGSGVHPKARGIDVADVRWTRMDMSFSIFKEQSKSDPKRVSSTRDLTSFELPVRSEPLGPGAISPPSDLSLSIRFRFFVSIIFGVMAMAYVHQFVVAQAVYTVTPYGRGGDFDDFYYAARGIAVGHELYPNFIKPPMYGVLVSFLAGYPLGVALTIYQGICIALILGGTFLYVRECGQGFWVQLACATVMCGSWAFGYVVDRGNADGWSMGLVLLACVSFSMRARYIAWILFAVAVNIKTNVLPLLVAFVLANSISGFLFNTVAAVVSILGVAGLTPRWNVEFVGVAVSRVRQVADISENISLYRLLDRGVGGYSTSQILMAMCTCIALGCIFTSLKNRHSNPLLTLLLFVPFTYAYPILVYPYSMVLAPLLILAYGSPVYSKGVEAWVVRAACCVGALGVAASCIPIIHWQRFLGDSSPLLYAPQLGICLTLPVNCILAWSPLFQRSALCKQQPESEPLSTRVLNVLGKVALTLILVTATISTVSYAAFGSSKVLWFPQRPDVAVKESVQSSGPV